MNEVNLIQTQPTGLKLPPAGRGVMFYWAVCCLWWGLMMICFATFYHRKVSGEAGHLTYRDRIDLLPIILVTVVYLSLVVVLLLRLRKRFRGTTTRRTTRGLLHLLVASHDGRHLTFRTPLERVVFAGVCCLFAAAVSALSLIQAGPTNVAALILSLMLVGSIYGVAAWRNELYVNLEARFFHRRRGLWPLYRDWHGSLSEVSHVAIVWQGTGFGGKLRRAYLIWREPGVPRFLYCDALAGLPVFQAAQRFAKTLAVPLEDKTGALPEPHGET